MGSCPNAERIVCSGDCNADFSRINSGHTSTLRFIDIENFCIFHNALMNDVDFTYENIADNSRSIIDHMFVSKNLESCVNRIRCDHHIDNMSNLINHLCLLKLICLWTEPAVAEAIVTKQKFLRLLPPQGIRSNVVQTWNVCCILTTESLLWCRHLTVMICCVTIIFRSCRGTADFIVDFLLKASQCIPRAISQKKRRRIHWWNQFLEPLYEKALFWHYVWNDCGRPWVVLLLMSGGIHGRNTTSQLRVFHTQQ